MSKKVSAKKGASHAAGNRAGGKAAPSVTSQSIKAQSSKTRPAKKTPAKPSPAVAKSTPKSQVKSAVVPASGKSAKANVAKAVANVAKAKPAGTKAPATIVKSLVASKAQNTQKEDAIKRPARTIAVSKTEQSKKAEGGLNKMAARAKVSEIVLPPNYRPSEDEPFMSELHRAYFRKRLIEWKDDILRQTRETLAILHEDLTQHADIADRATSETDRATELRTRDRQRKLIAKIDAALSRIEDGSYGYCEETGEPIGLKRLDARPIATLSVEAQERHERRERVYREE